MKIIAAFTLHMTYLGTFKEKCVILVMESHCNIYRPIETKYLHARPGIAILETTLGDVHYRLG